MPLGQVKSNFNYNLDEKRVLNFENVVNDNDNIKQDMSIDVRRCLADCGPHCRPSNTAVRLAAGPLGPCSKTV